MARPLRLLSANLANGAVEPRDLAELIERRDVDIAVVQELTSAQAGALAEVLPHGDFEPASDFTGMGIASRHPAEFQRIALVYRRIHIARMEAANGSCLDRELEVIGVHIAAPHAAPFWAQPRRRSAQLAELLRYTGATSAAARVIAGDFNATPLWPVYRAVAAEFDDLVAEHAQRMGVSPSRTWPQWRGPALVRIDHCFGKGVKASHSEVVALPGSDHYALLVELAVD